MPVIETVSGPTYPRKVDAPTDGADLALTHSPFYCDPHGEAIENGVGRQLTSGGDLRENVSGKH